MKLINIIITLAAVVLFTVSGLVTCFCGSIVANTEFLGILKELAILNALVLPSSLLKRHLSTNILELSGHWNASFVDPSNPEIATLGPNFTTSLSNGCIETLATLSSEVIGHAGAYSRMSLDSAPSSDASVRDPVGPSTKTKQIPLGLVIPIVVVFIIVSAGLTAALVYRRKLNKDVLNELERAEHLQNESFGNVFIIEEDMESPSICTPKMAQTPRIVVIDTETDQSYELDRVSLDNERRLAAFRRQEELISALALPKVTIPEKGLLAPPRQVPHGKKRSSRKTWI